MFNSTCRSLESALEFTAFDMYLNPARAEPSLVKYTDKIVMSKTSKNAVFLTAGIVGGCDLVDGCSSHPTYAAALLVKRILLFTFKKEYNRLVSFIGMVMKMPHFYGPCVPGCLSLSTKKDGAKVGTSGGMSCLCFFFSNFF